MTTTDDQGHVFLDVTRSDGSHEQIELPPECPRCYGETDEDWYCSAGYCPECCIEMDEEGDDQ
jgi:hypothetical protein